jgi:hypothetical protein
VEIRVFGDVRALERSIGRSTCRATRYDADCGAKDPRYQRGARPSKLNP